MTTPEDHVPNAGSNSGSAGVDLKFEAVVIPLPDAGRAKGFYSVLGWRLDADFSFDNGFRVVHEGWPGWYAEYMVRERTGQELLT